MAKATNRKVYLDYSSRGKKSPSPWGGIAKEVAKVESEAITSSSGHRKQNRATDWKYASYIFSKLVPSGGLPPVWLHLLNVSWFSRNSIID